MKKFLSILLISALVLSVTACVNKKSTESKPTTAPTEEATTTPSSTVKPTLAPEATGQVSSVIEKVAKPDKVPETQKDSVEKNFAGTWYASASTTQNSSLENIELTINYDSYNIKMTFSSGETPEVEYSGKYTIKDGVLKFDKNFDGCTAYFYDGDKDTLILDNGTSLIYCKVSDEIDE